MFILCLFCVNIFNIQCTVLDDKTNAINSGCDSIEEDFFSKNKHHQIRITAATFLAS